MSQAQSATRFRTLRDWAENLGRPAPPVDLFAVFLAMLALTFAGLVGAAGMLNAGILWTGDERLAASNEFMLATVTILSGLAAVACATSKSNRTQNYWIIVCLCGGGAAATIGFIIYTFFVPEGPGWFGSYGKPNTIWVLAVAAMSVSSLMTGVSRLLHQDDEN